MPALPPEVLGIFREEVREYFDVIADAIAALEAKPAKARREALVEDVARRLHNIKGAASSLGIDTYARVAHAAEEMLLREAATSGGVKRAVALLVETIAWMQRALDEPGTSAAELLANLGASETGSGAAGASDETEADEEEAQGPVPASSSEAAAGEDSVRVSLGALEHILRPLALLVTQGSENRYLVDQLRQIAVSVGEVAKRALVEPLGGDDLKTLAQAAGRFEAHTRKLETGLRTSGRAVHAFEDDLRRMRLVPLASLEKALQLVVRDAAARTSKQVTLVLEGAEVGVDRRMLEALRPPLVHLLRNAVDHGIESGEQRRERGKPIEGRVQVSLAARDDAITVTVQDDGGGIDAARVKAEAAARGLSVAQGAEALSPQELWTVLSTHGFSTAASVTELSGRGVGLDVVQRSVSALGGRLGVETTLGVGTRFVMTIPATLLTTRVLLVRGGEQIFGLPVTGVEQVARVKSSAFFDIEGHAFVELGGRPARLQRLGRAAGQGEDDQALVPAVLVMTGAGPTALLVDAVLGEDEVVVTPLGPPVRRLPGVQGVTLADSGKVVLVLNPAEIDRLGTTPSRPSQGASAAAGRRKVVLVVDDSITTRTLERHILESNGYEVRTATDGAEALRALQQQGVDVVVSDVEMPRLDGLELTRAMRRDEALRDIPLLLVTSRGSDEDRRKGLAAGADAYLAKNRFDQHVLLSTLTKLLAGRG